MNQLRPLARPLRSRIQRLGFFFTVIILALGAVGARLVQLQVLQHRQWADLSVQNHRRTRVLEKKRGDIIDRNGVKLALSSEVYTVYLYTPEVASLSEAATLLSTVLPQTRDEILATLGKRSGYLPIARQVDCTTAARLRTMRIPGVNLEEGFRRVYPERQLAANVVGFCSTNGEGLEGIELSFDKTLRGYPGLAVEEDVAATRGETPRLTVLRPAAGGSNLTLTVDAVIQHILESELAAMVAQHKPHDAHALAMDPQTGEILGMACWPSFDLNQFSKVPADVRRNRSVLDIFEPGSCMKIFSMAAGYLSGKITDRSRFHCRGYTEVYGKRIRCHGAHGLVDPVEAIAQSCNSSMIAIAQTITAAELYRTYRGFGFSERSGVEVPQESTGILRPPSRWSGLSAPSLAIGQEIAVTAIQLVRAYGALANDGVLLTPHLVKSISSHDGDIVQRPLETQAQRAVSPELARKLRQMLFKVVETGSGKLAALPDYTVGGKTSTAQKANPTGGYFHEKVVTSFIGICPIERPRLVLLVAANEPRGDENTLYGGKVAAPYFARIADRILKHMKVPPDRQSPASATAALGLAGMADMAGIGGMDEPASHSRRSAGGMTSAGGEHVARPGERRGPWSGLSALLSQATLPASIAAAIASLTPDAGPTLPDLTGRPLREVACLLRETTIDAVFEGNGLACRQSVPAGTPLAHIDRLVVHFTSRALEDTERRAN